MERYRTTGRQEMVARIAQAIVASGGEVLRDADPSWAPYELLVRLPDGEIVDLVCYAFTANEYRQAGRPEGEHRFQVKYGSKFDRYHTLFVDPSRKRVTLMFGVHTEMPLFIAVDPRMHNPTWFSMSIELKEEDLIAAKRKGWHGWQRERADGRRKRPMPELDLRIESVIAFRPEQFLRFVLFERVASGMDCGARLHLSDEVEKEVLSGEAPVAQLPLSPHRLEGVLGLTAAEVLEVIGGRFRLLAAVRGGVAEHHLGKLLTNVSGVSTVERIDKDRKPDFRVVYRRRDIMIECKNVLARRRAGRIEVDFQKTRHSKDDPCSRYYARNEFDVLAACIQPITGRWEFRFRPTRLLEAHTKCDGRLSQHVLVAEEVWTRTAKAVLDEVLTS